MIIQKLASAIRNDVIGGLRGYHTSFSMSMEQLEDAIVDERLQVIKEYESKGVLPVKDLIQSINCIPIDCSDISKCSKCLDINLGRPISHFEIPQTVEIKYIGSVDKQNPFVVYTSFKFNLYHKYRKRGKDRPYVWVDTTPNDKGMYDCFLFNAPLLKWVSVVAVFKDPRQLCNFECNDEDSQKDDNFSFINNEIKRRLTEKLIRYYRQLMPPNLPNTQEYTP